MSENTIVIENVSKSYGDFKALNSICLNIPKGKIFGLLGPNGAGKTTLIRILNDITKQDSGEVLLNGKSINKHAVQNIGYLPEERGLYKKMQVMEQALYLAQLKGMTAKEAKTKLNMWFDRLGVSDWQHKKIEELSKGMAQKIQFITTVVHEPELLILDEPFSGFDPLNAAIIRKEILRLKDEGCTILLSSHNMSSVEEICDEIALINKSEVVLTGKINELKESYFDRVYEVHFKGHVLAFTNALWAFFELIDREEVGDLEYVAKVRLLEGKTVNDLLRAVMDHVEILDLRRAMPSLDEIFIQVVAGSVNEKQA